jgi:hypothetical protein
VQNELMLANPAGLLYGAIMVGTLLAAESAKRETYVRTVGAVLIAMVLLWLVRGYTSFTAHRLRESAPLELSGLVRTMAAELAIVLGGAPPLIAVMISWAVGASLNSAVVAGVWTSAGVIIIIELISGVRAGQTGRELVFQTAFGALLGLLVIALRLLLH